MHISLKPSPKKWGPRVKKIIRSSWHFLSPRSSLHFAVTWTSLVVTVWLGKMVQGINGSGKVSLRKGGIRWGLRPGAGANVRKELQGRNSGTEAWGWWSFRALLDRKLEYTQGLGGGLKDATYEIQKWEAIDSLQVEKGQNCGLKMFTNTRFAVVWTAECTADKRIQRLKWFLQCFKWEMIHASTRKLGNTFLCNIILWESLNINF